MSVNLLIGLAGLMGAAGVALWSASAHLAAGYHLDTAAYMLLFHAPAIAVIALLLRQEAVRRQLGLLSAWGLALGAILFSADLALHAFAGVPLFGMAAPSGGIIVIAGWLLLVAAALVAPQQKS